MFLERDIPKFIITCHNNVIQGYRNLKLVIIVLSDTSIITRQMLMKLMDSKKGGVVPPSPQQDTVREIKEIDTLVISITRVYVALS